MIFRIPSAIILAVTLSGCSLAMLSLDAQSEEATGDQVGRMEKPFKAVMIVQEDGSEVEVLTGNMYGHISGRARWVMNGPTYGNCVGNFTVEGLATMTCENGINTTIEYGRQAPAMSGVNVFGQTIDGKYVLSGFGWGRDANEAAVRQAMAEFSG